MKKLIKFYSLLNDFIAFFIPFLFFFSNYESAIWIYSVYSINVIFFFIKISYKFDKLRKNKLQNNDYLDNVMIIWIKIIIIILQSQNIIMPLVVNAIFTQLSGIIDPLHNLHVGWMTEIVFYYSFFYSTLFLSVLVFFTIMITIFKLVLFIMLILIVIISLIKYIISLNNFGKNKLDKIEQIIIDQENTVYEYNYTNNLKITSIFLDAKTQQLILMHKVQNPAA
ncbi:hypothetical protein [Spiroplasma endosymbiont of Labia minor]|uniref:hypothetical protein n=1 Tax=Spiroplasma endosymbiont of Labia minor TaxID=3066305 RepID=UPI0030CAB636